MSRPLRRVLMLTAAWPPIARVGGRRPLRLARRLPALGWEPIVLTPEPDAVFRASPPTDPSLQAPPVEVLRVGRPVPSTRLHRRAAGLPGGRLLQRAVAEALLPDQYVEWIPAALAAARRVDAHAVWATGPPFGMHVAGAAVARMLGLPLILDYRDPWTVAEGVPRARWQRVPGRAMALRRLERALLERAAAVVYVADDIRDRTRRAFPTVPSGGWRVIPNGFDGADVGPVAPLRPLRPTLLYAGSCYGSRSMRPVLGALADGFGPGERGLRLQIFGELDPAAQAFLDAHPLPGRVAVEERVPAAVLAAYLRGADGLLLIVGGTHHTVPAKLFDYMAAGRPVVGLGAAGGAAAAVVERCGIGLWCRDRPGLIAALRAVEKRAVPYAPVAAELHRFSADAMAERLVALLDGVVRGRPAV